MLEQTEKAKKTAARQEMGVADAPCPSVSRSSPSSLLSFLASSRRARKSDDNITHLDLVGGALLALLVLSFRALLFLNARRQMRRRRRFGRDHRRCFERSSLCLSTSPVSMRAVLRTVSSLPERALRREKREGRSFRSRFVSREKKSEKKNSFGDHSLV